MFLRHTISTYTRMHVSHVGVVRVEVRWQERRTGGAGAEEKDSTSNFSSLCLQMHIQLGCTIGVGQRSVTGRSVKHLLGLIIVTTKGESLEADVSFTYSVKR